MDAIEYLELKLKKVEFTRRMSWSEEMTQILDMMESVFKSDLENLRLGKALV